MLHNKEMIGLLPCFIYHRDDPLAICYNTVVLCAASWSTSDQRSTRPQTSVDPSRLSQFRMRVVEIIYKISTIRIPFFMAEWATKS